MDGGGDPRGHVRAFGSRWVWAGCGAALLIVWSGPTLATSFVDQLGGTARTRPIADALSRAIVRSVPLTSASAGIAYSWDDTNQTMAIDHSLFGQPFLERPDTIGRANWSVSTIYQHVQLDTLDGRRLDELRDVMPPICDGARCRTRPYAISAYHPQSTTNQVTHALVYGLLEELELNLAVPVLASNLRNRIVLRDLRGRAGFSTDTDDDAAGIGDIALRAKYLLLDRGPAVLALGVGLSLPTGNEDDLQGTGAVQVSPGLFASSDRLGEHLGFRFQPYVNLGADLDGSDIARSEVHWGTGLDVRKGARVTFAVGFLGRHVFEAFGPSGALDVVRCTSGHARCLQADPPSQGVAPLLAIEDGRRDLYDMSVGFRVAFPVLGRRVIGTVNVLVPLNDEGIRADVTPLVGVEVPFVRPRPSL